MRIVLWVALLAAPALWAQDSLPIAGSVPADRRLTWLFEADFGSPSTNFTIACELYTPSPAGLIVRLIDLDLLAGSGALNPPGIDEKSVPSAGTALASLSGSYAGKREFVVEVESAGGGSNFTGNLIVNTGTLLELANEQLVLPGGGFKSAVSRLATWGGVVTGGTVTPSSFEVDLGPNPRTVFFRFFAAGSGLQDIQLLETTGGSTVIRSTFTGSALPQAAAVPLTGTGVKTLRVNVRGGAGTNSANWAVVMPTGVSVRRVGGDAIGAGGADGDDGCVAAVAGGLGILPLVMLALARGRRRRFPYRPADC